MKITLVNIPYVEVYKEFERAPIKSHPLGLAYIASSLEQRNHEVVVVDGPVTGLENEELVAETLSSQPDIVATGATTPIAAKAIGFLREVKKRDKKVVTVLGGPHASALPNEIVNANGDAIDFVVKGEGESGMKLVETAMDVSLSTPVAINSPYEEDLDSLPFPAWDKFDLNAYIDPSKFDTPYLMISGSRGCPFGCTFCGSRAVWGKRTRFRSPANIVSEIKTFGEKYGIREFVFVDETFCLKEDRVIDICKGILELPFEIQFFCSSRTDTINDTRLSWLKKAGCSMISFGPESGNDEILKLMHKGITVEQSRDAVRLAQDYGIRVHCSFMLGNVGDTEETIRDTIDLILDLNIELMQFTIVTPMPGTLLYEEAVKSGRIKSGVVDHKDFYFYYSVAANMSEVSDERLLEFQREAYQKWTKQKGVIDG